MAITQKQVAASAGVSQRAVAFAVSDDPANRRKLRPETQRRILEAATRLGYRKNRSALTMRGGRSGLIGVLHSSGLLQVATLKIIAAAEAIYAGGFQPLTADALWIPEWNDFHSAERACDMFFDMHVEGIVMVNQFLAPAERQRLLDARIPMVQISGNQSLPGVTNVRANVRQGMDDLMRHLLALGHRRMTMLTLTPPAGGHNWQTGERCEAYRCAMRRVPTARGRMVTLDNRGIPADQPHEAGRRLASQLLAAPGPRPEVLVCQNDDWAHGALAACAAAGLRVPEEIAVTGFDGSPLSAGGLAPLTTVVQPCREMAIRAVELLLGRIRGKARGGVPREIKLPCQVLVRQSCGAAWRATPASVSPNITRNKKEKAT